MCCKLLLDQNIDDPEVLKYLTEEQINIIAPSIGDKIRIQQLIHFLKHSSEDNDNVSTC